MNRWNHLNEERKYFDPIRNYMSSSILLVNTRNLIFNRKKLTYTYKEKNCDRKDCSRRKKRRE